MVRVALIGCGRIGQRHAKILGEGQIPGAKLCAVVDIIPDRAEEGQKYHVPYFVEDCTNDLHAMTAITQPDLITIATPSGLHADHIRRLLPLGIPLLVEKPLALCLDDLAEFDNGVWIGEVKQNRYNLAVQHLKRAILDGRLDNPRLASVRVLWARQPEYYEDWHGQWTMAGGVLANQAIHHIDLLWWLLGDVRRVSALATYDDYTEVETGLVATLEFANGCIATLEVTTLTRPKDLEGSLTIVGDKGLVELGGFAVNKIKTWQFTTEMVNDDYIRRSGEQPPDVYGFGHIKMYEDVVSRLENHQPPLVSVVEAGKALEIVNAIYEAVETGEIIELNGKYPHSRLCG